MLFRLLLKVLDWAEALAHREVDRHLEKLVSHNHTIEEMTVQADKMEAHQDRLERLAHNLSGLVR